MHLVFDIHGVLLLFGIEERLCQVFNDNSLASGVDLPSAVRHARRHSKEILAHYCPLCDFKRCGYVSASTDHGLQLPHLQEAWETGKLSNDEMGRLASLAVDRYVADHPGNELLEQLLRALISYHTNVDNFLSTIVEVPGAAALMRELAQNKDVQFTVLSNGRSEWIPFYRERFKDIFAPFTHFIMSNEAGKVKPDPTLFDGVPFDSIPYEQTVFLDDMSANIICAQQRGIHGILVDHRNLGPTLEQFKTFCLLDDAAIARINASCVA